MAKRNAQNQPKMYKFDIKSLLISDESQDEQSYSPASSTESSKHPKKFKNKDSKPILANKIKTIDARAKIDVPDPIEEDEEVDELNDVSKFFENVGNDFGKSMQVRRTRLNQFTDAVVSIYESKLAEMINRQEFEVKEFKEHALQSIQEEFIKGEEEFKKLMLQQNKIVKALKQQIKLIQKTAANLKALTENSNEIHRNFIQEFEDLKVKHRNEALDLKKSLGSEMTALQNEFLAKYKKEEMETLRKYFIGI